MPDLYITLALPNPAGKDRPPYGGPSSAQLNREWVEFSNAAARTLDLSDTTLFHYTFTSRCQQTGRDQLIRFKGELKPGYSIRVHTGTGEPSWEGTVRHLYLCSPNYVWNNSCGDIAVLATSAGTVDWARYKPDPSEGKVLRRVSGTNDLR